MGSDKYEGTCRYNENVLCEKTDCGNCGWNPVISEKRLEEFRKKHGVQRKRPRTRLIDAVSTAARITTVITPMVEKGFSQHRILAEVMKCISASRTVEAEPITRCYECKYSEESKDNSQKKGAIVCHNTQTPCKRRRIDKEFYCPYGERKTDGAEND